MRASGVFFCLYYIQYRNGRNGTHNSRHRIRICICAGTLFTGQLAHTALFHTRAKNSFPGGLYSAVPNTSAFRKAAEDWTSAAEAKMLMLSGSPLLAGKK